MNGFYIPHVCYYPSRKAAIYPCLWMISGIRKRYVSMSISVQNTIMVNFRLVQGKFPRKPLHLMVKTMVSGCDFPKAIHVSMSYPSLHLFSGRSTTGPVAGGRVASSTAAAGPDDSVRWRGFIRTKMMGLINKKVGKLGDGHFNSVFYCLG